MCRIRQVSRATEPESLDNNANVNTVQGTGKHTENHYPDILSVIRAKFSALDYSTYRLSELRRKSHFIMAKVKTTLSTGWQWRMADANGNQTADNQAALKEWSPASSFPSVIHMELLSRKLIPNPNIGENERLIQWVGEPDWEYACSFMTPDGTGEMNHVDLVFEGLDTYATVWLNETQILKSDNMFIPERVSIKKNLKASGAENELRILFESPLKATSRLEDAYGPRTSMMRDKRRMHARKAQVRLQSHLKRNPLIA